MSATVIQHRRRRRKPDGAWAWALRRPGVLIVTLAGLIAASWFVSRLDLAAMPLIADVPRRAVVSPPPPPAAAPELVEINVALDLAGPPVRAPRRTRVETGIPLNAAVEHHNDGYEILSAAELASISQARE